MRIVGIDPGLAIIGYGVIDLVAPGSMKCISYGCIRTDKSLPLSSRLHIIYTDMQQLLERYQPDEVAMERLYFNQNVTTGIKVSNAVGVILLALEQSGIPFFEYTPLQLKSRLLGHGHAEKKQIQSMVARTLKLKEIPKPDDAADGLGLAICHSFSRGKGSYLRSK